MASSLEKAVDAKEDAFWKKKKAEEDAEIAVEAKRPTYQTRLRRLFPSVFEGEFKWGHDANVGWTGVIFKVKDVWFSLTLEHYHDDGTPTEGYGPSDGWHWVLNQGWNCKQLNTFSDIDNPDPKRVKENHKRLVDEIHSFLNRSW